MLEEAAPKVISGALDGLAGCAVGKCCFPEMGKSSFQAPPAEEFTPLRVSFLCQDVCNEGAVRECLTLLCTVKGEHIVDT